VAAHDLNFAMPSQIRKLLPGLVNTSDACEPEDGGNHQSLSALLMTSSW